MTSVLSVALAVSVAAGRVGPGDCTTPTPAAARLSTQERAIVDYIDRHDDAAATLLERAVNINSGTLNLAGVRQVGALFRAQFDSLGFTTRWDDGAAYSRAGHLVAQRGTQGPRVLLVGHLDTVFEPDSPFQRFERQADCKARGPGAIDMKGGDVIIVQTLKALKAAGLLDRLRVTVVLTGDEERAGAPLSLARRTLMESAKGMDLVLGFEDGDGDPRHANTARRSATTWQLTVTGTPAHSSQIFRADVGYGAVYEAARILDGFRSKLAGEQYLTLSPGVIAGGTTAEYDASQSRAAAFGKDNVVAGRVVVTGDLRTLSPEQFARAQQTMQAVVAEHLTKTDATLTFEEGYPPMAPTPGNAALLQAYTKASEDLGLGPVTPTDPAKSGAADVAFVAAFAPKVIDALGLRGVDGHTDKETADMRTLSTQAKRAGVMLARVATAPSVP